MATASPRPVQRYPDPSKPSKYPVRLAACILEERRPDSRFYTTRFNHKPSQIGPRRTTTITHDGDGDGDGDSDGGNYTLTIRDGEQDEISKVSYTGHRAEQNQDTDSYVLIFDREQQSFTLNPVDSDYAFNISSTPWESNAANLARDYKQISRDDGLEHGSAASPGHHAHPGTDDDEALFGEHADEPDAANPFDFRHFLDAPPGSPVVAASRAPSTAGTPMRLASSPVRPSGSAFGKGSPLIKAKASPLMKPNKHRRNISTSSLGPGRATAAAAAAAATKAAAAKDSSKTTKKLTEDKPAPAVPRVQLERKASTRLAAPKPKAQAQSKAPAKKATVAAGEDDDILIIEGEDDEADERAYTPAFRGTPNGGAPVSLSQLATASSPAGFDRADDDQEEDDDIGGIMQDDDDEDDDDVQSITLGTPAHPGPQESSASHVRGSTQHLSASNARPPPTDDNDAEDDQVVLALEAELLSGLESEEEDDDEDAARVQSQQGPPSTTAMAGMHRVQAEESDESEEE